MKSRMIVGAFLLVARICAQDPAVVEGIADELMEDGHTEEAEELVASVTSHMDHPIDLNSCTKEELANSGIFTPFQVFVIMDQRERYGPFFSRYELAVIPGISREFLEDIKTMIAFSSENLPESSSPGQGMLMTNVSGRFPVASGMRKTSSGAAIYQGDPLKVTQRIQVKSGNHFSLGAAYEKDPGEPWTNRGRPEHLTGYLSVTPATWIRKIVIGNFRIHRGMGLVHGLGFRSRDAGMLLNGYRRSYAKPFASTLEYDYFRGIYGEVSLGKWETDLFLSHQPADISFFRLDKKKDLFGMIRKTGLHRTESEREGFDLARFSAIGTSVNRSGKHYYAGGSFTGGEMHLTGYGMDSLHVTDPLKVQHAAMSLYGVAFGPTFELYGEVAMDNTWQGAFILGGTVMINPAFSCDASVYRVPPEYRGGITGSAQENEDSFALRLGCEITPFSLGRIRLYHELQLAAPDTYRAVAPVPESYTTMTCFIGTGNGPAIRLKYTGKTTQEIHPGMLPGNGILALKKQQHYRIHYRWAPVKKVILQGRFEISVLRQGGGDDSFDATGMSDDNGSMVYQQVQVVPREGIRITYRYLLFHVMNWENRIYSYEPGVKYSFLFPAWYGKGSRNVLVLSAKILRGITLRGKCGLTQYAHRWESGTGNDTRKGSHLFDVELQLQADLF